MRVIILVHWKECIQLEIISNLDLLPGLTNQNIIFMLKRSYFLLVKTSDQGLKNPSLGVKEISSTDSARDTKYISLLK